MAIGPVNPIVGDVPVTGVAQLPPGGQPPAGGSGASGPAPSAAPPAAASGVAADPVAAALDAVLARALARQDGLAPVFALKAALAAAAPGRLPAPVAALLGLLDAAVVRPEGGPAMAEAVRRAAGGGLPAPGAAGPDLAAVLVSLRAALGAWLGTDRPDVPARPVGARPEPPRRSAPPRGEPVPPRLEPEAPPSDPPAADDPRALRLLAARLLDGVERASERLVLHQAAALPDDAGRPAAETRPAPDVLSFAVPVATPAGVAVAEVRVERDPPEPGEGDDGRPREGALRVDLALSVEPLGPMRAHLGLMPGGRLAVGVWCEREAAARRLAAGTDELRAALEAAGLAVADVVVQAGRPPDPAPAVAEPVRHRLDVSL